jgi:hypothetical protein
MESAQRRPGQAGPAPLSRGHEGRSRHAVTCRGGRQPDPGGWTGSERENHDLIVVMPGAMTVDSSEPQSPR